MVPAGSASRISTGHPLRLISDTFLESRARGIFKLYRRGEIVARQPASLTLARRPNAEYIGGRNWILKRIGAGKFPS